MPWATRGPALQLVLDRFPAPAAQPAGAPWPVPVRRQRTRHGAALAEPLDDWLGSRGHPGIDVLTPCHVRPADEFGRS